MRWTPQRKLSFIRNAHLLDDELFAKYLADNDVSCEEFCQWEKAILEGNALHNIKMGGRQDMRRHG